MATVRATIEEPAIGTWVIDADVQPDDDLSEGIAVGGQVWVGLVTSSRLEGGVRKVRVVGGTASIGQEIPSQSFAKLSYSVVLSRILQNTGFSGTIDDGTLGVYALLGGPLGLVLGVLSRTIGLDWWVTRAGSIVVGTRAAGEVLADRIASDLDSCVYFSCTGVTQIVPGMTYEGRTIRHVRWRLSPERLLAEVSFTDYPRSEPSLGYELSYAAKIVSQVADQPLVNVLVGERMGITEVPLLVGGPFRVKMSADDPCRVAFVEGDPRRPYAFATGQRGSKKVAREGDTIDLGSLQFVDPGPAGPEVLTWLPPATEDNPIPTPIVISSSPVPIYGVINSGSPEVSIP